MYKYKNTKSLKEAIKTARNAEKAKMRRRFKVVQSTGVQLIAHSEKLGIVEQIFIGGSYPTLKSIREITNEAIERHANEKCGITILAVGEFRCGRTLNDVINGDEFDGECETSDEWQVNLAYIPAVQSLDSAIA